MKTKQIIAIDLDGVLGPHMSAIFTNIRPYVGSVEAMQRLSNRYELHVVTARYPLVRRQTRRWLKKYFPGIFTGIHFVHYSTPIGPRSLKSKICKRIGADYIIDDKLSNAEDCARNNIKVYLFGIYHTLIKDRLPAGVTWVKDWEAVFRELF